MINQPQIVWIHLKDNKKCKFHNLEIEYAKKLGKEVLYYDDA